MYATRYACSMFVARVAQRRARSPALGIRSAHKRHTTARNSKQTPQIPQLSAVQPFLSGAVTGAVTGAGHL